jgi:sterol 3beta-glucosyltransferase
MCGSWSFHLFILSRDDGKDGIFVIMIIF